MLTTNGAFVRISPAVRLTIGLVMMTVSILMLADILGLTKDKSQSTLEARTKFTEALAIQLSKVAQVDSYQMLRSTIEEVVKRNQEILSIGIRSGNGVLLLNTQDHKTLWKNMAADTSTSNTQIQLAIYKGNRKWGVLEVTFEPIHMYRLFGVAVSPMVLMLFFVSCSLFVLFVIFLKRTLRHLDPSSVIPERVRSALDVLAEGVLILDKNDNIVLANISFSKKIGEDPQKLLGKRAYELSWDINGNDKKTYEYPWRLATKNKESIKAAQLSMIMPNMEVCNFAVNCAPILDEKGRSRGVLSTFDDVTQLERRNTQLQKMLDMLKESQKEVHQKNKELEILATKDPLTNALNRRAFFEKFDLWFQDAKEEGTDLSCIMLDIDHFKNINDTYGHQVGDVVIQALAETLRETAREEDLVCRYGGEEFCVVLKGPCEQAQGMAERLRQLISMIDYKEKANVDGLFTTSSFGVAEINDKVSSPTELVELADRALYCAKENGRNRVVVWHEKIESLEQKAKTKPNEELPSGYKDVVTDLPVRTIFLDGVRRVISQREKSKEPFAILMLDIDMFKRINNTLGHKAGDDLLREISQRLRKCVRGKRSSTKENDGIEVDASICRLGGDEFGILIEDLPSEQVLKDIIDRIINQISQPYQAQESEFHLSCSIGVSRFPANGDSSESLIKNAELAMYHAKKKGRNAYFFYTKEIDTTSTEILQLEYELQHALENDQFILHYQPKVNSTTTEIAGFEALLRWDHPRTGLVPPIQFITLAEEIGQMQDIGQWVILQACKDIRKWIDMGYKNVRVSVNMSILQFKQGDLFQQIESILKETKVSPKHLELEITESTIMENLQYVVHTLERLHQIGLKISIDDFGTGYSSLSYIKRFPVDTLKIDRSFILNIKEDEDDRAIVAAIIAMAHAMGLSVVAEGVEDEDQLRLLAELDCNEMQGYLFSKPVEFERATVLLDHVICPKDGAEASKSA